MKAGIEGSFRPEFINRLDEDPTSADKDKWIVFNRLNKHNIRVIAKLQLEEFKNRLLERHGTLLEWDPSLIDLLVQEGFNPAYGARPMRAAVQKYVVDPLASWILKEVADGHSQVRGGKVVVSAQDGKPVFTAGPKPQEALEKTVLEGAAEKMTRELLDALELSAARELQNPDDIGGVPTESGFDAILQGLRDPGRAAPTAAPARRPLLNGGVPAPAVDDAVRKEVAAEHNEPARKDKAMRAMIEQTASIAKAAGFSPDRVAVLQPEASSAGQEGWLRHFVRHAKTMAEKAGAAEPVRLEAAVDASRVVARVHSPHAMSADEEAVLQAHFTGTPSEDLRAAQQKADARNLTSAVILDHNLLELYRRLLEIPGARLGYATGARARGGSGTDYWLELPKEAPAAPAPATERAAAAAPAKPGAVSVREREQTKDLLLKALRQEKVSDSDRDGPGVKIAAATSWAMLSTPEDAKAARRWVLPNKWMAATSSSDLEKDWHLLLAFALVMERHGNAADIPVLEKLASTITSGTHVYMPVRRALSNALTTLYARAGEARTRAAYDKWKDSSNDYMKRSVRLAMAEFVAADELAKVEEEPDAYARALLRAAPEKAAELLRSVWPPDASDYDRSPFKALPTWKRTAVLRLVAA
ncbi:MAG TPA: hypothetical protein VNI01_05215, partial [Elusimicrobiota bacterium]|nr:hypothetical protein [Elusimicrobiota bacterium]